MPALQSAKKVKTVYACTECGATTPKWMGRCPGCGKWDTLVESEPAPPVSAVAAGRSLTRALPERLGAVALTGGPLNDPRISTGLGELDFVLGGGGVRGGLVVLSGEPGVGKSTICLQIAAACEAAGESVLYVSGEESAPQVAMRAQRLGGQTSQVTFLAEKDMEAVEAAVTRLGPAVLIVDSIQMLETVTAGGACGTPSQIKACGTALHRLAKERGVLTYIIGHVTKDGTLAGPQFFNHLVDTVVYFEHVGDGEHRMVRCTKNRFGSVDEIAVFRMTEEGLVGVGNPSELFLADRARGVSGSAITAVIEGTRPLLIEVQALVTPTAYATPQRVTTGFSRKRLALLVAILEKRIGLPFSQYDVFMNVVGGLNVSDPATDAAVLAALVSSVYDVALPAEALFLGEVGLGGEMRRVAQLDRRLSEGEKLGFTTVFTPASQKVGHTGTATVRGVDSLGTLLQHSLGWTRGRSLPKSSQPPLAGKLGAAGAGSSGGRGGGRSRPQDTATLAGQAQEQSDE